MDPQVESALIAAAATLVGVGGTVIVAIAAARIARRTNQATIDAAHADAQLTLDTAREGQLADHYSRALEQVGSANSDVRIGGIYALEGIALDSPRQHPTVMEVLTAFIRQHSREQSPEPNADSPEPKRSTRPDIQAALTVIARRDMNRDISGRPIDLAQAVLPSADLHEAKLADATLTDADLTAADLAYARLIGADLDGADLTAAILAGVWQLEGVRVPDGWMVDSSSGRLKTAAQLSEVTDHYF